MKTLLLMRHAKSSWNDPALADHDRPLNGRGLRDAMRMGRWLAQQGLAPGQILCSSARRAKDTAALVAENCGYAGPLLVIPELYGASPQVFYNALVTVRQDIETLLVVCHNPDLEIFTESLSGQYVEFSTGTLAHLKLMLNTWQEINTATRSTLEHLWHPKGIK